jgi:hypothetical protein
MSDDDIWGLNDDEVLRLARLGKLVEAMPPGHFIGREYPIPHAADKEWDYCKVDKGEYINLGTGFTAAEALMNGGCELAARRRI